jgi:hypothetical protein
MQYVNYTSKTRAMKLMIGDRYAFILGDAPIKMPIGRPMSSVRATASRTRPIDHNVAEQHALTVVPAQVAKSGGNLPWRRKLVRATMPSQEIADQAIRMLSSEMIVAVFFCLVNGSYELKSMLKPLF